MRVLVVEDEIGIAEAVGAILRKEKYIVDIANNGKTGLEYALTGEYDCILLDIMLPGMNGLDVLTYLRVREIETPVLLLTAKSEIDDKIKGLDCGADDYLTKPFSMDELVYRIEAILRRAGGKTNKPQKSYELGSYVFDTQRQTLTRGETQVRLTTKECELLTMLCMHAGDILQREVALKSIWVEDNYFNARSMDVYITKLRKLLKDDDRIQINNVHGKGYRLILPPSDSE